MSEQMTLFAPAIAPKTYEGQRVVTLRDIDEIHHKPEGTARKRFNDNKKHFLAGTDYFVRKTDEAAKELGIVAPNGLVLLTLTGYLMIVKSFTDDLSWAIQRELVTGYFSGRRTGTTFMGTPVITVADYCRATGEKPGTVQYRLKARYAQFPLGSVLFLDGYNLTLFKQENPEENRLACALWIMTQEGAKILTQMYPTKAKSEA